MSDQPRANIRTPLAAPDQTPISSAQLRADMRSEIASLRAQLAAVRRETAQRCVEIARDEAAKSEPNAGISTVHFGMRTAARNISDRIKKEFGL